MYTISIRDDFAINKAHCFLTNKLKIGDFSYKYINFYKKL